MFKENWSMKFNDWSESDECDIEGSKQKDKGKIGNIPAITEAPTMSMSEDGDSHAGSTGSGNKVSTKTKVVRWYNNRGKIQKVSMIIGIVILFITMLAVAIWAVTNNTKNPTYSSSSASESIADRDYDIPIVLSTAPPTMSPSKEEEVPNNILENQLPTDDPVKTPDETSPNTAESPSDTPQEEFPPKDDTQEPPQTIGITYAPGLLKTVKHGLTLSEGLDARIVAVADEKVVTIEKRLGGKPKDKFHSFPDAGATFELPDGGWIYVSNSEAPHKKGGVGALTFDKNGEVRSYDVLLKDTSLNKGGGKTPFGTWVSCEENGKNGKIYQVDPTGKRKPEVITLGREGGSWESFAYDVRDEKNPRFFVTEDAKDGALQRFTPKNPDWEKKPWEMLHKDGTTEYLVLVPNASNDGGEFIWTQDKKLARENAKNNYSHSEGLDLHENKMYFVCKKMKQLFVLDLDAGTYSKYTTEVGLFDGSPDQVLRVDDAAQELLYFTEDSKSNEKAGVHARDHEGKFYTILESELFNDETTGLAFSPDGRFMYIAYQASGLLYAVWRTDGYPFHHQQLNINYHG